MRNADCGMRPSEVCSALHGPGIAEFGINKKHMNK
jgi:hypothetical protein